MEHIHVLFCSECSLYREHIGKPLPWHSPEQNCVCNSWQHLKYRIKSLPAPNPHQILADSTTLMIYGNLAPCIFYAFFLSMPMKTENLQGQNSFLKWREEKKKKRNEGRLSLNNSNLILHNFKILQKMKFSQASHSWWRKQKPEHQSKRTKSQIKEK